MSLCYILPVANQSNNRPVLRFAPSPTGHLHLGHALSAFENERWAEVTGGRLLLRIEDIDTTRCRPEFVAALLEDLAWLELPFEQPPRRQSAHFDDYRQALDRLAAMELLYRSYASRAEIAAATGRGGYPRDPDGTPLYPRAALAATDDRARRDPAEPYALRLDMAKALAKAGALAPALSWREQEKPGNGSIEAIPAAPERWGDVVLARKEFPASYHLAVVVDDALQGITHVVRGRDLYHATGLHRLLQSLLALPEPTYHHHGLILGPDGEKLSKSARSTSLRALRADGATPAQIRKMAVIV
ncbi:tRNA glutamyl-Q(34) synthetase GluQRS [Labrys sp. KNU-23]|uniref:tRNA glutamyl-Q(34) synthetase GluQRS n=1 Tax=Labrys sp. KNU-23 TaxID=2789216 RepID=UPI0011EDD2F0|nr:tRNA glutamyl-Q(34) synthetase GluQRS [Labrys sp. KNU-23]QEN88378.1 tRNA glutamyl-Q(34) synthetase GluQRS [Labrys sp. KNU-23]